MEYIEQFDYKITYVKGELNKVADCLSRYYANNDPEETHPFDAYVNADARFDPEGEELPAKQREGLRAKQIPRKGPNRGVKKKQVKFQSPEDTEDRRAEAIELLENQEQPIPGDGTDLVPVLPEVMKKTNGLLGVIRSGYKDDVTFAKIAQAIHEHPRFQEQDGLLYTTNLLGNKVLCIPRTKVERKTIPEIIIDSAHTTLGHFGH
jgi:hypothetical protein